MESLYYACMLRERISYSAWWKLVAFSTELKGEIWQKVKASEDLFVPTVAVDMLQSNGPPRPIILALSSTCQHVLFLYPQYRARSLLAPSFSLFLSVFPAKPRSRQQATRLRYTSR